MRIYRGHKRVQNAFQTPISRIISWPPSAEGTALVHPGGQDAMQNQSLPHGVGYNTPLMDGYKVCVDGRGQSELVDQPAETGVADFASVAVTMARLFATGCVGS